ncbi:YbdD/YjiX family protein [Streptomyces sp. NPDC093252]|uniref:YbdD/YjiX family protein n=1 Tax=Streptomyces sp. NPDC093252 TaxID=3154980 RepID=UPI003431CF83
MRAGVRGSVLGRIGAGVRWYLRELTDESAYDRYCAHLRKGDAGAEVPSRREFERMRGERAEGDPREGFRCC